MLKPVLDVVIPAHHKDLPTLNHAISAIKKHARPKVRRVIVVSKEKYTDQASFFDEAQFPFSIADVKKIVGGNVGWYFQQLLKLYAPLVIPGISPNVLILDSDTVFFRKTDFFSKVGLPLYNLSKDKDIINNPFYQQSLDHIKRILPELAPRLVGGLERISAVCHHMVFQRKVIEDLFKRIESHGSKSEPAYEIFLKQAVKAGSACEYNLYFYFLNCFYPNQFAIRNLNYKNTKDFNLWKYQLRWKYHYCSFHSYMREA